MQRLALMMAVMGLGMPQVYSCNIATGREVLWGMGMSEPGICPPVGSGGEIGISAVKEQLDKRQRKRLPAIHCMVMQSSLSFMCGLDGRTRKVKYEKFRQPCGVQLAACWEALKNSRLKVGEMEYSVTINQTRSHMAGEEGRSGGCRQQVRALERKIVQVLMEVLVEEDWIWWNADKNQVATKSGKVTTVPRGGEAILEDGLWGMDPGQSRRSQPSHRWGRDSFQGLVKNQQREEHRTGLATPAVQRGSVPRRLFFCCPTMNSHRLKS